MSGDGGSGATPLLRCGVLVDFEQLALTSIQRSVMSFIRAHWVVLVRYWFPACLWATLIFLGSGNALSASHTSRFLIPFLHACFPFLSQESLDWVHFIVRKGGHMTEYFVLTVLLWRGLSGFHPDHRLSWRPRHAFLAWTLAVVYAASDEFHQTFTSSRQGSVVDVLIDASGATVGLLGVAALLRWRRYRVRHHRPVSAPVPLPAETA